MPKERKHKVGEVKGANDSLLILGTSGKGYLVKCLICEKDPELNYSATYRVLSGYLIDGSTKLPCSCSKSPAYSHDQWVTIAKRKAKENNQTFFGFCGGMYINQHTKLILECNTCQFKWDSCSMSNYIRDRGCPNCAKRIRGENRSEPDSHYLQKFKETRLFPDTQYSFVREHKTSRLWKVICTECPGKEFISDRSNLIAGKIPCDCSSFGGYDVKKPGYFYLLTIDGPDGIFTKYGISNFPKRRFTRHRSILKLIDSKIVNTEVFSGNSKNILEFESHLKRTIQPNNKRIEGFQKESCSILQYSYILSELQQKFTQMNPDLLNL